MTGGKGRAMTSKVGTPARDTGKAGHGKAGYTSGVLKTAVTNYCRALSISSCRRFLYSVMGRSA
jgi:hypothetical protein